MNLRRIPALATAAYVFASSLVGTAFAVDTQITVTAPTTGVSGKPEAIAVIISQALKLAYGIALLLVLVFMIIGAFNWITSGGDKDKVKSARGLIVNALIGLVILAVAVLITNVVARILNLGDVFNFVIPGLPSPSEAIPNAKP